MINKLPTPILSHDSPFQKLFGCTPDSHFLKTFGCTCFPHLRPYNSHKLQFRSSKCLFLGYSSTHKGYLCLHPFGKIYISRNVIFNEHEFPYSELLGLKYDVSHPISLPESSSLFTTFCSCYAAVVKDMIRPRTNLLPVASAIASGIQYGLRQPTQIPLLDVHTSPTSQPSMSLSAHAPAPCHPMITRAKAGIFKPKVYAALKHPLSFSLGSIEPMCVKQVLADPNWKIAMKEEYKALMRNDTWDLVPYQPQYNVVGNKWVFKLKFHLDDTLNKHKASLVAKGFHQTPGVDFSETYSPAIKLATIRVVLTLAIAQGWEIRQLDINNAFLNGYLQENVFMSEPKDFIHPTKPHHICKLRKALYGLKQAPRAWFDRLKDALLQWGFQDSKSNASLFLYKIKGIKLMPLVYVDNILITGNNRTTILDLVHDLNKSFLLKDLGSLHYFLGIKAFQDETCLYLTQSKYIADLLQKTNMAVAKPLPTPTISRKVLSKSDGDPMDNPTMYRSTVGALQYVTITRPDISYMVSKLSQFLQSPTEIHWKACNRVLLYLKGTITHGLHVQPNQSLNLVGFTDAD